MNSDPGLVISYLFETLDKILLTILSPRYPQMGGNHRSARVVVVLELLLVKCIR